jgi:hypothetical protein
MSLGAAPSTVTIDAGAPRYHEPFGEGNRHADLHARPSVGDDLCHEIGDERSAGVRTPPNT